MKNIAIWLYRTLAGSETCGQVSAGSKTHAERASVTVSGQTTTFLYDGDGNLVKKTKPDGSKTIYVGGIYEVDKTSGGTVTRTLTYYPAAGAMRINTTLYYMLKDHLGSASVVTDASGVVVGEQRYYPYGETRLTTGTIYTDKLFTGQREITGLGIYHFNARFYSPKLGRFLSADTIVPGYANPQNLNRFSYVGNNPLRYTDPTGHMMTEGDGGGSCFGCDNPQPDLPSCGGGQPSCGGNGGSGDGGNDDDGGGGDPVVSIVLPGPACYYSNNYCPNYHYDDALNYFPMIINHPSGMSGAVGMLPVYSSTGELIGYRLIYYAPNDYHDVHYDPNAIVTTGLPGFAVSVAIEIAGCTLCAQASLAATGVALANQSFNIVEYPHFGGVYPTENPLQPHYNDTIPIFPPVTPNLFSP